MPRSIRDDSVKKTHVCPACVFYYPIIGYTGIASFLFHFERLVERVFQHFTRFEMGLAACGDINDFTGAGIACGGFGPGILDLKNTESSYFDSVSLNQLVAHEGKNAVHHT